MLSYITLTTRLKQLSRYYHFHFRYKEIEASLFFICLFTYSLISPSLSCLIYVIKQGVSRLGVEGRGERERKRKKKKEGEKSRKKIKIKMHIPWGKNDYPKAIHLIFLSSSYLNIFTCIFIFCPSSLQSSVQPYKPPVSTLQAERYG